MAQQFDVTKPSRLYTASQWTAKEDWYADQINNLQFSVSPSPAEIQDIAIRIDALLSVARIDYAFANQTCDKYNLLLKIEEKRLFVELKMNPPQQFTGLKLTVDEMKGVVASVLNNQKWDGGTRTLYELVRVSTERYIYMEAIIKALQDKKDLLITHNGILKIENSLSGMSSNAPKINGQAPISYDSNYKHTMED